MLQQTIRCSAGGQPRHLLASALQSRASHPARSAGYVRNLLLLAAVFTAGVALSAIWLSSKSGAARRAPDQHREVSAGTTAVLNRIQSPVEIRFYRLLDTNTAADPEALIRLANRTDQLLAACEAGAKGKIKINRIEAYSDENARAAVADGVVPFNLERGDASFLGLVVAGNGRTSALPRLDPAWESALEPDLARALAKVLEPTGAGPSAAPAVTDPAIVASVKEALPDYRSLPIEEGVKALRKSTLTELEKAAQEMEARIAAIRQKFGEDQASLPEGDLEALRKQIESLEAEQTRRIKQIVERSQAQIEAFKELKSQP